LRATSATVPGASNGSPWRRTALSSTLATNDELVVGRLATRLLGAPEVQAEAEAIAGLWASALEAKIGVLSDQDRATLGPAVQELAYAYAQKVANGDPARPKVSWIEAPPHAWSGERFPGGRYAADNPDTIYRIMPVDGLSTYRVDGRIVDARPATTVWQVVTDPNILSPVANLDGRDLTLARDGSFSVTIGPEPTGAGGTHLQTTPDVIGLFVRDTLSDWATERAPALSVERISGPPRAERPHAELVAETVRALRSAATLWIDFYIVGALFGPSANAVPAAAPGPGGIHRSSGNFDLGAGEALVVTLDPVGAAYVSFVVQNAWSITPEYWARQTSLTGHQAVPGADGTYTLVVSATDPGAHNWVDTGGLARGTFLARWQGLPVGATALPVISGQVVPTDELPGALPAGTVMVTPEQRAAQLRARLASFLRRAAPA
jgi:hypothetical protein